MNGAVPIAYTLALAAVAGGLPVLCFLVAPTLFRALPSRMQAAALFGRLFTAYGGLEVTASIVACSAAVFWAYERPGPVAMLRLPLASALLVLSILHHLVIFPLGERVAAGAGNFDRDPDTDAERDARARFKGLHRLSMAAALATLALAVVLLCIRTPELL